MSDIEDLIDALQDTNFNQAKKHFDALMSDKMSDALDQEKINVASAIFNDADVEEDEDDYDDDIEAAEAEDDDYIKPEEYEEDDDELSSEEPEI